MHSTGNILSTNVHISPLSIFVRKTESRVYLSASHVWWPTCDWRSYDVHNYDSGLSYNVRMLPTTFLKKLFLIKSCGNHTSAPTTTTILLALYGSNTYSLKDKDKVSPSRALKAYDYKRCGITAPSILSSDTRRSWVVNFTHRSLYFWGNILG